MKNTTLLILLLFFAGSFFSKLSGQTGGMRALVKVYGDTAKVALLFGNSNYEKEALLIGPSNNVDRIKKSLLIRDFTVYVHKDRSREEMLQDIASFARKTPNASVIIVYYAGHGYQYQGENYLVPVDVDPYDEDAIDKWINIDEILVAINQKNKPKLVLFDACRELPQNIKKFGADTLDLSRIRLNNSILAYSTSKYSKVNDDNPFAEAFSEHLLKHRSITDVLNGTMQAVANRVDDQNPGYLSHLITEFDLSRPPKYVDMPEEYAAKYDPEFDEDEDYLSLECDECPGRVGPPMSKGCPLLDLISWKDSIDYAADSSSFLIREIRNLKESNAPEARARLAYIALVKKTHKIEKAEIDKLIISAHKDANPFATYLLGLQIEYDRNDAYAPEAAKYYYEKAAEKGNPFALWKMGNYYESGKVGVPLDTVRAIELYKKSWEFGYPEAAFSLGKFFEKNKIRNRESYPGGKYFLKAADAGHAAACAKVGELYFFADFEDNSINEKGQRYYKKGIERGSIDAMLSLGLIYYQYKKRFGKEKKEEGVTYLKLAASLGSQIAIDFLKDKKIDLSEDE